MAGEEIAWRVVYDKADGRILSYKQLHDMSYKELEILGLTVRAGSIEFYGLGKLCYIYYETADGETHNYTQWWEKEEKMSTNSDPMVTCPICGHMYYHYQYMVCPVCRGQKGEELVQKTVRYEEECHKLIDGVLGGDRQEKTLAERVAELVVYCQRLHSNSGYDADNIRDLLDKLEEERGME